MSLRVVVTVADGSLEGLDERLVSLGFEVTRYPLLTFGPPDSWRDVDRAVRRWTEFSDVVFTSPRAASAFLERLDGSKVNASLAQGPPVWAGGPATADVLGSALGAVHTVEIRGGIGPGRGLGETLVAGGVQGPVLYICGDPHREEFATLLRQCDVEVVEAVCYRSHLAETGEVRRAVADAGIVVVGSPRVVDCIGATNPEDALPRLVTLGPTSARAAEAIGWQPAAVSLSPSIEDVTHAVVEAAS